MVNQRRSIFFRILPSLIVAATMAGAGVQSTWAEVSVWEDHANGQGFFCNDDDPDVDWRWPDNDNWSQQQTLGPWPCDLNQTAVIGPSNWSTPFYPDNGNGGLDYDVVIGPPAPTDLDVSVVIDSLIIQEGGVLEFLSGETMDFDTGFLTNDGLIRLTKSGTCASAGITFHSDTSIDGLGEIDLNCPAPGPGAIIAGSSNATVTHGANHHIHGRGEITAKMINNGVISADMGGRVLALRMNPMTNNGVLQAIDAGLLEITGITVTQGPAGLMVADGGEVRLRNGVSIMNGTLHTANGGVLNLQTGTNRLKDVINTGQLDILFSTEVIAEGSALTNDGTILLNATSICAADSSTLVFDDGMTLQGTGELILKCQGSRASVQTASGAAFIHGPSHMIRGTGELQAAVTNLGTIMADVSGSRLALHTNPKHNQGTIGATNGGLLEITGITITNGPSGQMMADNGTVQWSGGVLIDSGTLSSAGSGLFLNRTGTNRLRNAVHTGQLETHPGTTLATEGNFLTNDGTILLNRMGSCLATNFSLDSDLLLDGNGELILNCTTSLGARLTTNAFTLTHAAGHTIRGKGEINGQFDNYGTISADEPTQLLTLNPTGSGFVNKGTLQAINGGRLQVNNANLFTNFAVLDVAVGSDVTLAGGGYTQTVGTTHVDGTLTSNAGPVDILGGVLKGGGMIASAVSNSGGQVQPGASPGVLDITGSYTQGPGGTLAIELGGPDAGDSDQLQVSGSAALEGTLAVSYVPGFIPQAGQEFTILTADSRSGQFSAISGPGQYQATYNPTSVVLTVLAPCQSVGPDLDDDCDVDADDLALFVSCASGPAIPHSGTPTCQESDLDADGDVDQSDFGKFQKCLAGENIPADPNCAN